jgi:histidinol-phosphate phosphatase family protein
LCFDRSWSLFLDRDGVINRRRVDDYVKSWGEFEFLPGVLPAMKILSAVFGTVVVVTNQQGVGKGLMTVKDVETIHRRMQDEVSAHGGRIDRVYFSPFLAGENNLMRKPQTGMALAAKRDFPGIDFRKSVMVGDAGTDIEFGKNAGMLTVLLLGDKKCNDHTAADYSFVDLLDFATGIRPE